MVPGPTARPSHRREWLLVGLAALLAWPIWTWRGKWDREGAVVDADITLITSDRDDLACAMPRAVKGLRCELESADRAWVAQPSRAEMLAPYFTTDRRMYLIAGLFEQPALKARVQAEPPEGRPRDSLRRFTAQCKLRLVEKAAKFDVRWERGQPWNPAGDAWVGTPITCRVLDDPPR